MNFVLLARLLIVNLVQGDRCRLVGSCNDRCKSDCLAYELCSISVRARYEILQDAVPSVENLFGNHLRPTVWNWTIFSSFIDSIGTVNHTIMEASRTLMTKKEDTIGDFKTLRKSKERK